MVHLASQLKTAIPTCVECDTRVLLSYNYVGTTISISERKSMLSNHQYHQRAYFPHAHVQLRACVPHHLNGNWRITVYEMLSPKKQALNTRQKTKGKFIQVSYNMKRVGLMMVEGPVDAEKENG